MSKLSVTHLKYLAGLINHLISIGRFAFNDSGSVSVRAMIDVAKKSNPRVASECQSFTRGSDVLLNKASIFALLGTRWLVPHLRRQIVAAGRNGLTFEELDTYGLVGSVDEFQKIMDGEAVVSSDSRIRRTAQLYSVSDVVVGVLQKAGRALSPSEIAETINRRRIDPAFTMALTRRYEIVRQDYGQYIHIDHFGLTRDAVLKIAQWGAKLLRSKKRAMSAAEILKAYSTWHGAPRVLSDIQLESIVAKHGDVVRPRRGWLAPRRASRFAQ